VLSQHIPEGERLVTIEDAAELSLGHPHVVRLETRPPNLEGTGEVAARDLVKNALRMRPSRIIVGEVRGDEVVDMLQAMNTGHEGSMTTIHANSARDAITRVEMLVGMGGFKGSDATLRHNIASAIDLVIQVSRLATGKRKVISVTELTGVADGTYMMQDLFSWDFDQEKFRSSGVTPNHSGLQRALGQRPGAAKGGLSIG
jgi:pilus assembly protein CpaF